MQQEMFVWDKDEHRTEGDYLCGPWCKRWELERR